MPLELMSSVARTAGNVVLVAVNDGMELFANDSEVNCVYWARLAGTSVSWLKLRSIVSMGVLAGVFVMMVAILVLSTFLLAPPTVNGAQVRVNVVVLLAVGPQVQGAMSNAYSGHWHWSAVKRFDKMGVVSEHFAVFVPVPERKKFFLSVAKANHHLRLPQLVAVQSHDVVPEMSMYDVEPEKAVKTGSNAPSVIILIGFPDKLITAPFAYWAIGINLQLEIRNTN